MPILGGTFGPQENSICQAAAIGAGGLSSLFVATLPSMYRLHLLSDDPKDDLGKFMTLCLVGSFFGVMFAVPLRKFFIINVARELRLVFPTCRPPFSLLRLGRWPALTSPSHRRGLHDPLNACRGHWRRRCDEKDQGHQHRFRCRHCPACRFRIRPRHPLGLAYFHRMLESPLCSF